MSELIVQRVRTKYHWPAFQLNFWLLIMLIASCVVTGIFSYFITVQQQLQIGIPWYVFDFSFCAHFISKFLGFKSLGLRGKEGRKTLGQKQSLNRLICLIIDMSFFYILSPYNFDFS